MTPESKSFDGNDLVVVGSSAGGVGALSTLVSTLPKDFPAPIVLAQHLDPQRPSHLDAILNRRSVLPIVVVSEDAPTELEGGTIYVVPSNRHVKIVDGHVHLESDHAERPAPSVDRLLSSAAESYGEHLIAVILTGSGSDGAAGAVAVKNAGGVVIIQNPETAAYPSMPLSLPPTVVDYVVEMDQIGPLIYDLLKGVSLPPPTEKGDDPLREVLLLVSAQTNIDFRNYKVSTILRRISRRMAVAHVASLRDYSDYLRAHPEEITELVKAFLIKVTGFFRDPEAFDFLKQTVLPELIDRARENGRIMRVWSAGCATGEEAYSMALLIADALGPNLPEWSVKIFATDLAADAIAFARRGLYPETVLSDLPDVYRQRYFERVDHGYRISKMLRETVIFGEQDISRGVPFPRIDLVVCRNLLIYLKPELQETVLDLFAYSLHQSHGYLFLGKAETARPTKALFELVNKRWKIYRCVGGPLSFPTYHASQHLSQVVDGRKEMRKRPAGVSSSYEVTAADTDVTQLRRINETMLRFLTAGVVIIDRSYRILTINATGRRLLGVRDVAYDQDFLHTVRGLPYQDIRAAIDLAFREHSTTTLRDLELDQFAVGAGRYLDFTVMAMPVEGGAPELAFITVVDTTEGTQAKKRLEAVQREQTELVSELSSANKRFAEMNKELQDANEELQAANEELMLTQEELQATNEEFEATNEELQATNEELETNNEELQATNEELQTTNDELTARTFELHHLTKANNAEQFQLSELLERFPYYVMIVTAADLIIEAVNPGYALLLGKREIIGLPVTEFFHGKDLFKLTDTLREVAQHGKPLTTEPMAVRATEYGGGTEDQFVHSIVPLHTADGAKPERLFIYTEKVA